MKTSTFLRILTVLPFLFITHVVFAQDDNASAESAGGLEEIIVTATRRESNLQTTPISISVINSDQIEYTSPRDIGDLSVFTPNFSAARVTSFANAASFALRGVGQNNIIVYFEPTLGIQNKSSKKDYI